MVAEPYMSTFPSVVWRERVVPFFGIGRCKNCDWPFMIVRFSITSAVNCALSANEIHTFQIKLTFISREIRMSRI